MFSQPNSFCSRCGEPLQATANFCPGCATPVRPAPTHSFIPVVDVTPNRKVGVGLALGIFFLPYIFSWFTLRQGYTSSAKTVSFIWLGVFVLGWAVRYNEPSAKYTGTNSSSAYQTTSSPTKPLFTINKSPEMQKSREKMIQTLMRRRIIAQIKFPGNSPELWVRPAFLALDFDMKKSIAEMVYAYYCDGSDQSIVLIMDSTTGKSVGAYSATYGGLRMD